MMIMRKLLLATVAVVALSASAHAERKRDILGFRLGMSRQEALSAMAKICKDEIDDDALCSGRRNFSIAASGIADWSPGTETKASPQATAPICSPSFADDTT
jgi:hypothetical protein